MAKRSKIGIKNVDSRDISGQEVILEAKSVELIEKAVDKLKEEGLIDDSDFWMDEEEADRPCVSVFIDYLGYSKSKWIEELRSSLKEI